MRPIANRRAFRGHVGAVAAVGLGLHAWLLTRAFTQNAPHHLPDLIVLAGLLMLSEQRPLVVQRRGDRGTITLSAIFACAILLRWDIVVAITVQAVASLVEDLFARRSWWKSAFNAGQSCLSLGAAGWVYHQLQPSGLTPQIDGRGVLAILAAGAVYFTVNTLLTGTAVALAEGVSIPRLLADDLAFQASVNGVMAGLAPVVIAVLHQSLWLVPLLLLPAVAVYHGGRLSLEKDHRLKHDALTELPNRLFFTEAVAAAIADRERGAIVIMDLDAFKELNDTLGHSAGDELLRQIGPRIAPALRDGELLARLGGDEFGILLPDVDSVVAARGAAEAVVRALDEQFELGGLSLDVRASMGMAVFPDHGRAVEELMQHADVAMYLAKRNRTGLEMYDPDRNQHSRRRLTLLNELRPAIEAGSLALYYQPKADMRTGHICGLEALLRWPHSSLGMVPPNEFIGLAEYSGLIAPLTEYVLDQAFEQMVAWQKEGLLVPVSVNLSARSLQDETLPARIARRLSRAGLPASTLVLELTETAIMAEADRALQVLEALSAMGIRLSIDDFGTGYSSLAYLSRLPVSEVKVDKSFVTHVDSQSNNRVIVQSTIELANNLGLEVVAEGVETIPVWQTLARLGCNVAQGYLIARPEPSTVVTELLRRNAGVPVIDDFAVNFGVNPSSLSAVTR